MNARSTVAERVAVAESVNVAGMFYALLDEINACPDERRAASMRARVNDLAGHALWYAWGCEDSSGKITHAYGRRVDAAWEFHYMYGIVAALYVLERRYMMPSVPNAWTAFKASIDLDQYLHVSR